VGELIQIDGSEHWWFEGRGPQCTLLVYIDDATSRLMHLQFVESESTFDYFAATRAYLERHGKPVAFYSDKHGVFRVNRKDAAGGDLPYRTFDKRPQVNQAAIVENKRLGPILAYIAEKQKELDMSRSAKAPRRRGQKNHMFKIG
jgi:hypothetical protein